MRPISELPDDLLVLATRQEGLVSTAQCDAAGVRECHRAVLVASGRWSRVTRGVYDIHGASRQDLDVGRRRAAWLGLLAFGPAAIAVGKGALALHGVAGLPVEIEAEAALPRGRDRRDRAVGRDRDRVRLREFDNGMQTVLLAGRQVATVEWALAQAVPELPRGNAVAVMDSTLQLGLITPEGLERAHDLARGRRGVARTHEWWDLADGRAESPLETFGRLDCLDVGVPPDELQVVVRDVDGTFLGRGDMGWRVGEDRWLIAEMDGLDWHESRPALLYDRQRQNRLMRIADVLRFTADDVHHVGRIGATVRRHLRHLRRTRGYQDHSAE